MLKARLYEIELRKKEDAAAATEASKTDNSWGNQIRNYVLHPYTMVKDTRSKHEDRDASSVLDGKIDGFIDAYLEQNS